MKAIAYAFYALGIAGLLYAIYYTIALDRPLVDEFMPAAVFFIAAIATQLMLERKAGA